MAKTEKLKSVPVASLKSLGGVAPEFNLPVTIPRLDGTSIEMKMRGKGMRKSEWIALRDTHLQGLRDNEKPLSEVEFSFATMVGERMRDAAELVCHACIGWQFDDAFTADNLLAMEDLVPGSVQAMLSAYDAALFHGKLGN